MEGWKQKWNKKNFSTLGLGIHVLGLKAPQLEIVGSRVFTQIRLVGLVTEELGQKILNFDGLGLRIAILYFQRCRRRRKKILSAVGDGVKIFKTLSPTALKMFTAVADSDYKNNF
jgi:hypothetical protein